MEMSIVNFTPGCLSTVLFKRATVASKSAATLIDRRADALATGQHNKMAWRPGTILAAAPPDIVPMLNVVVPKSEEEGQSTLRRESRHEMRCSIAETPSSG